MKKTLSVLITVTSFVLSATGPATELDIKAITAKPTADNPQFQDRQAWPELAGDEYFLKEKWPEARLLIWAHPGENQARQGPKIDPLDPACWIDAATGKPAEAIPDMDTDIILPDSGQPYKVLVKGGEKGFSCRHLTIGRNSDFQPGGGGALSVFGNLWIRPAGSMFIYRTLKLLGSHETFFRRDWPEDGELKKIHDTRAIVPYVENNEKSRKEKTPNPWNDHKLKVCHFMAHDKTDGKSTEITGYVSAADEIGISSGTLIVGHDSRFLSVGPGAVTVRKGAKLILMDGALCSHGQNQFVNHDWVVGDGAEVGGGTPDRPLRRDAYFGVGYRNWMNLPVPPAPGDSKEIAPLPSGTAIYYGYAGHNAMISGSLIGYPAPGSNARLVVCWQRIAAGGAGAWGRQDEIMKSVFPKILPKIDLWFSATAMLENVRFDDLHRGGIVAPSMDAFRKWKNISFGDACLSKEPNDLVRGYQAEIATMKNAGPMSILEPKEKYTTK